MCYRHDILTWFRYYAISVDDLILRFVLYWSARSRERIWVTNGGLGNANYSFCPPMFLNCICYNTSVTCYSLKLLSPDGIFCIQAKFTQFDFGLSFTYVAPQTPWLDFRGLLSREWRGVGDLLLRDGDGKGGRKGNEGRERRQEEEGGRRKGREEPVLPIKNRSRAPAVQLSFFFVKLNRDVRKTSAILHFLMPIRAAVTIPVIFRCNYLKKIGLMRLH